MPQQLIYTSSRRGLNPGSSGYCTVAKSKGMSDFLSARLEQLSYYRHLSLVANGADRPIFCFRRLDVRGKIYYVITYLTNTELDFTQRTNFVAHHLVFNPDEIKKDITPPIICRDWSGWVKVWNKEPELLVSNIKLSLPTLDHTNAQTWEEVTHDSTKAFGLLSNIPIAIDLTNENDDGDQKLLTMFSECLQLIEVQRPMDYKDGKAAWEYTFTTSLQAEDNPSDFRWCCVHSSNPPGFQKLQSTGQTAVRLNDIQAPTNLTPEKKNYAESGYQAPEVTVDGTVYGSSYKSEIVHNFSPFVCQQGGGVKLEIGKISGVPTPTLEWLRCEDNKVWLPCKVNTPQNTGSSLIFKPEIPRAFTGEMHFNLSISNNRDECVRGTFTVNITPIPPEIFQQPVEPSAKVGDSVEFKVVAKVKGVPDAQLRYQWYLITGNGGGNGNKIDGANSPVYKINSIEAKYFNSKFHVIVNNGKEFIDSEIVGISDSSTRARKRWEYDRPAEGSSGSNSNSPRRIVNPSSNAEMVTQNNHRRFNINIIITAGALVIITCLVGGITIYKIYTKRSKISNIANTNNAGTNVPSKLELPPEVKGPLIGKGENIYVAMLNPANEISFLIHANIISKISGHVWEFHDDNNNADIGKCEKISENAYTAPKGVTGEKYYKCRDYVFLFVSANPITNRMSVDSKFIEAKSGDGGCKIELIGLDFKHIKSANTDLPFLKLKVSVLYKNNGKPYEELFDIDQANKSVDIPSIRKGLHDLSSNLLLDKIKLTKIHESLVGYWEPFRKESLKHDPKVGEKRPPVNFDEWTNQHLDVCKNYVLGASYFNDKFGADIKKLNKAIGDYREARTKIANLLEKGFNKNEIKDYFPLDSSGDISSIKYEASKVDIDVKCLPIKVINDKINKIYINLSTANNTKLSRKDIKSAYIIHDGGTGNTLRLFELKFD